MIIRFCHLLFRLMFAEYFNHPCLLAAQRDFIPHYFVFYWVFQRGIQQNLYSLAFNKTHFYNSFAETAMPQYFNDYTFFSSF